MSSFAKYSPAMALIVLLTLSLGVVREVYASRDKDGNVIVDSIGEDLNFEEETGNPKQACADWMGPQFEDKYDDKVDWSCDGPEMNDKSTAWLGDAIGELVGRQANECKSVYADLVAKVEKDGMDSIKPDLDELAALINTYHCEHLPSPDQLCECSYLNKHSRRVISTEKCLKEVENGKTFKSSCRAIDRFVNHPQLRKVPDMKKADPPSDASCGEGIGKAYPSKYRKQLCQLDGRNPDFIQAILKQVPHQLSVGMEVQSYYEENGHMSKETKIGTFKGIEQKSNRYHGDASVINFDGEDNVVPNKPINWIINSLVSKCKGVAERGTEALVACFKADWKDCDEVTSQHDAFASAVKEGLDCANVG